MKANRMIVVAAMLLATTWATAQQKEYRPLSQDTTVFNTSDRSKSTFVVSGSRRTVYVNENITTHIVMPENVKMADLSTRKIVGNQCADNMLRIKPAERLYDNELAGTVTLIGERHMIQLNVVYTSHLDKVSTIYEIDGRDLNEYTNREVSMSEKDMARYAWNIYNTKKKFYNIAKNTYGIHAQINNIYAIDNYFFIDFSLYNKTKIKYDVDDIRLKLTDKKQGKATNSQTIELTPVWVLNKAKSFQKGYRNIIVIDKLTFPNEKILRLEISERQISGRAISLPIEYADVLHADGYDRTIMGD